MIHRGGRKPALVEMSPEQARWEALAAELGVTYAALVAYYCREMAWELDEDNEAPLH
jgi:hypothetical protein